MLFYGVWCFGVWSCVAVKCRLWSVDLLRSVEQLNLEKWSVELEFGVWSWNMELWS